VRKIETLLSQRISLGKQLICHNDTVWKRKKEKDKERAEREKELETSVGDVQRAQ
jgi:hypothetical protein